MVKEKTCKCSVCKKLVMKEDDRWVRFQCPLNPNLEYLNGMGEEPFVRNCKDFENKYDWLKVEE